MALISGSMPTALGMLFPSLERGMHIWSLLCIVISVPLALIIGLAGGHFAYKRFTSPNQPSWIPIVIAIILITFAITVLFSYGYIFTADGVGGFTVFYFTYFLIIICSPVILIANLINGFFVRRWFRGNQVRSPLDCNLSQGNSSCSG